MKQLGVYFKELKKNYDEKFGPVLKWAEMQGI